MPMAEVERSETSFIALLVLAVVLHKNNLQRELSLLTFFCGKRKLGKPIGYGAQKNGLWLSNVNKGKAFPA